MPDSSLLVYAAPDNHPLGLEPGDIVLGYDGIPWKILYKEILEREFPIGIILWGSNDKAFTHCWLTGAGRNWHLFDTIDIKKYSGEIVHLPTSLLKTNTTRIVYSEQLPVPGVYKDPKWKMSWGIVDGTEIGYLYIYSWYDDDIEKNFYNALDSLINVYDVKGLIIDLRANTGGYFQYTNKGLNLLFDRNTDVPDLGLAKRNNPNNHYSMSHAGTFQFFSYDSASYDKPIAVLSGPLSISAGDFLIKRLKAHPQVKVFGKTSSSAFAQQKKVPLNNFSINYAFTNGWSEENPNQYLTHIEQTVDYEVSFTPDDVRNGFDTVVETALEWIRNSTNIDDEPVTLSGFYLYNNYPNPFNPATTIKYTLPENALANLFIYDILGREIEILVNEEKPAGTYEVEFNASSLSSGVYLCKLQANTFSTTKKLILIK